MPVSEEDRFDLHRRLIEVLGQGPADTIMGLMRPPSIDTYREAHGEFTAGVMVVGLCADRIEHEIAYRDDMIRIAHGAGASIARLAEVSKLDDSVISDIVGSNEAE